MYNTKIYGEIKGKTLSAHHKNDEGRENWQNITR
jgi:hypothetical protein